MVIDTHIRPALFSPICENKERFEKRCDHMEHDLMGEEFLTEYREVAEKVKADPASVDLREFIRDELDGCLFSVLFNQQGRAFAGYYYGEGDSPYYPCLLYTSRCV